MTALSSFGTPLGSGEGARDLFSVPDIRTDAPSAPGSETSRVAARLIEPHRKKSYRKILLELVAAGRPMSREELAARTGYKESGLCGRLSDRELRPEWVAVVPGACVSSSGITVDGYVATPRTCEKMQGAA